MFRSLILLAVLVACTNASAQIYQPRFPVGAGPPDNNVTPGESIQDAIGAAAPGSVITVQFGLYAGFTVDGKPLTLLGVGSPQITGPVSVQNLDPGALVALGDFELNAFDALSNAGCVVVSGVRFSEDFAVTPDDRNHLVQLENSVDVRASEITVDILGNDTSQHGLGADGGRAEVAQAVILSARGADTIDDEEAGHGGFGLLACNGARAHVSLTSLTGGTGGETLGWGDGGGDGGHAIQLENGSELILTGVLPGARIVGGTGRPSLFGSDGRGGDAISLFPDGQAKTLRWSGVDLDPGDGGPGADDGVLVGSIQPGDVITNPADADPTLELIGVPQPNVPFTLRVWAKPGTTVELKSGTQAQVLDDGLAEVELLVVVQNTQGLGVVPGTGFINVPITLNVPQGSIRFYQAEVTEAPSLFRTNSVPVLVR